jgi:lipopolysaccharide export system protein LptA
MKKILLILLTISVLFGCKTKYIPVVSEKTKLEYRTQHEKDSIYLSDTVRITQRGDTVFMDKIRYKYKFVNKTDTVVRADTVTVTIEKTVTETKQVRGVFWWIGLGCCVGIGIFLIIKIYKSKLVTFLKKLL